MENMKQATEPSTLDASATSTIAGTTSLVTETTGKVTQRVKFQLSVRIYLSSYNTCNVKLK